MSGKVEAALRASGLTDQPADYDSDIHSWRCRYPDRYGPCECFQELVADLDRLLAKAWEEGRCAAARGQRNNPYIDNPSKDGED